MIDALMCCTCGIAAHTMFSLRLRILSDICTRLGAGHTEAVLAVQFSPDSKRLASGSGDTCVRFWNLNTETADKTCKGAASPSSEIRFLILELSLELWHTSTPQIMSRESTQQRQSPP